MMKRFIIIILGIAVLGSGVLIGIFIAHFLFGKVQPAASPSGANPPQAFYQHDFINPTVTSNLKKHFIINFLPLKNQLTGIQKKYPQKTYIYFAYLNNGSWFGLNERDLFVAASTIKVPLAMSLLKSVEDGKLKLTDRYSLENLDLDENFGELYKVGSDKQFTIEDLMKIMLEQSDNTATRAIFNIFKKIGINDPFAHVYESMGWQTSNIDLMPAMGEASIYNYQEINLKTLTNMFLALYNANYINIDYSEKILDYLAHTPFNDKIAAGIPSDIAVAHKIGIATDKETFSDCGIVYAPNRNYVLCVGSNGGDEKRATQFMAEVSKAAYDFVINN